MQAHTTMECNLNLKMLAIKIMVLAKKYSREAYVFLIRQNMLLWMTKEEIINEHVLFKCGATKLIFFSPL